MLHFNQDVTHIPAWVNCTMSVLYIPTAVCLHAEGLNTWHGVTCTNPPWCNMHKATIDPIPLHLSKINCSTLRSLCHKNSVHSTGLPLVVFYYVQPTYTYIYLTLIYDTSLWFPRFEKSKAVISSKNFLKSHCTKLLHLRMHFRYIWEFPCVCVCVCLYVDYYSVNRGFSK